MPPIPSSSELNGAQLSRRRFLAAAASTVIVPSLGALTPGRVWAVPGLPGAAEAAAPAAMGPESLVRILYESLSDTQKKEMCFAWDHVDKTRGLLRTRIENNWRITKPYINTDFYTKDQQALIRSIFEGMTNPDWHKRFDQQLKDDVGGYGNRQSIAIFGTPPDPRFDASKTSKFQFVLTSRHMTLRCDGNSAEHVAFGGPILYAHEGKGGLHEKPGHEGNVFWFQAQEASKLFTMLDGRHKQKALVIKGMPSEELIAFRGPKGEFQGVPIEDLAKDQKAEMARILQLMLDPFRKSDQDEALTCLKTQGGLDKCHLAFYQEGDLGDDKVYDNWRIEGPSFVWYFRGKPHVHVWVNIADDPSVKLNSFQDSIM
jgi:hypothetical protein